MATLSKRFPALSKLVLGVWELMLLLTWVDCEEDSEGMLPRIRAHGVFGALKLMLLVTWVDCD